MASKLLNVLEGIENSRQQIIKDARQKNYYLDDDASFDEIGDVFKELPVSTGKLIPMAEAPETLLEKDAFIINSAREKYLNEPIFLDYLESFKNTRDVDGYTPLCQILLDTSRDVITFAAAGNYTKVLPLTEDQIQIGNMAGTYYADYPVDFKVITSDGATYDFEFVNSNTDITHTHTWDSTKDVGGVRWFKVYIRMHKEAQRANRANYLCSNSYSYLTSNQYMLGTIPILAYYMNRLCWSYYRTEYAGGNSYIGRDTFKYIFETHVDTSDVTDLIDYMNTYKPSRHTIVVYLGTATNTSYWKNFKAIVSDTPYYNYIPTYNTYEGGQPILIDCRTRSTNAPTAGGSFNGAFYGTVRIVPYAQNENNPTAFPLTTNGLYVQTSSMGPHRVIARSNFLVTPGCFPTDVTITKLGGTSDGQNQAPASLVPGSVIEIPETITSIGSYAFFSSGANTGELDLHHVDTIIGPQALSDCYAIMIRLDNVKTLNYYLFDYIYCRELTLNNLEQTTVKLGNHAFGLLRLDIPKLQAYNFEFPESPTIEIINAPMLTHMVEKPFRLTDNNSCFTQLHTLILGDGIETSLNLTTCISLSKESTLDIITKLKDYTDGDQHVLTLNHYTYALLDATEIQIATNKNWVVNHAGVSV